MLELETLVDTPSFALAHDAALHCLYVTWRGAHDANFAVENYALIRYHVRRTQAHCLLNDSSLALDGWNEVTGWLGRECFPSLVDEGMATIAWVEAQDWPARAAIEETLHQTTRPLVDTFEDTMAAYSWLCAQR